MSIGISAGINGFVQGMMQGQEIKNRREDREWQHETRQEDRDWRTQQRGWAIDDREWNLSERKRLAAERKSDRDWTREGRVRQRELWAREDTLFEREEAERQRQAELDAQERRLLSEAFGGGGGGIGLDTGTQGRRPTPGQPAGALPTSEVGPRVSRASEAPSRNTDIGPRVSRLPDAGEPVEGGGRGAPGIIPASQERTAPEPEQPGRQPDRAETRADHPDPQPERPEHQPDAPEANPDTDEYTGPTLMGDLRNTVETWDRWGTNLSNAALGVGPAIWNNGKGAIEATGQYLTGRTMNLPEVEGIRTEGLFGDDVATEDDAATAEAEAQTPSQSRGPDNYRHIEEALRGRGPGWSDYVSQTQAYESQQPRDLPDSYVGLLSERNAPTPQVAEGDGAGAMRVAVDGPQAAETPAAAEPAPETTREGTPAPSTRMIQEVSRSIGLGGDVPSEEQRDRGARDFQRHYDEDVAPKLVEFYMRNGEPEKAEAFRSYMQDQQVRKGMGHWTRAVMAAQIGDEEEFIHQLSNAYNTDGYYDDGLSINPSQTRFMRDGDDVTGAEITFINDRTGESFTRRYESDDLYRLGINSLSMESAFEDQFTRYQEGRAAREEAQPSNKDILDYMEQLGDPLRGEQAEKFNAMSPAERRAMAVSLLTGGPGLGATGGADVPVYGARN